VFSTRSLSICYKREKLGRAVSQSVKRKLGGWCEMAASLGISQLWDIRQPAAVLLFILWSLLSNGFTCHNVNVQEIAFLGASTWALIGNITL
jgi:hypothetical protein